MQNYFQRALSWVYATDEEVRNLAELKNALNSGAGINIAIELIKDEDGEYLVAESTNTPGKYILTTGTSLEDLNDNVKDAIFTAFKVPAYLATKEVIKSNLVPEKEGYVWKYVV